MNYYTNGVYILFLLVSLLAQLSNSFAQSIAVGGPKIPSDFSMFKNSHVFEKLVRESVSQPLLRKNVGGVELLLAEGIRIKSNFWEIKIKDNASFSNKIPVTASDVIWSYKKCQSEGLFSQVEFAGEDRQITMKFSSNQQYEKTIEDISQCPILEEASTEIFDKEAGKGSNMVSSGNYMVSDFKAEKSILLRLIKEEAGVKKAVEIELKGISNPEDGLSQLRAGSLVMFFTTDTEVLKKVGTDTTLRSGTCQGFSYAKRADSRFDCENSFDLSLLN